MVKGQDPKDDDRDGRMASASSPPNPDSTRGACQECKDRMRAQDDGWAIDLELENCGCSS